MKYKNLILILFFIGCVQCFSVNANLKYCDDLSPYFGDINLDQISGVWNGVEKIPHTEGEYKIESNECFHINIREIYTQPNSSLETTRGFFEQNRIRHFVLEWLESKQQTDYYVKVNSAQKGLWQTENPNQSVDKTYTFFGGIIQALAAENNYLVLNFCMRLPYSQLYSVVLTKKDTQLAVEDLAKIHNIFYIRNISISGFKRVCENSALALSQPSLFLLITWTLMAFNMRTE